MINSALVVGYGEVGQAHYKVLRKVHKDLYWKDIGPDVYDNVDSIQPYPTSNLFRVDLLMIATQCDHDIEKIGPFMGMVKEYVEKYNPKVVDILTTCPPGTCDKISEFIGMEVNRSTIRGSHPCLDKFLLDIPKHIGGPQAEQLAKYYGKAGIKCRTHSKARGPEIFHILNNSDYGTAIMKAKENYDILRKAGVDYMEYLEYKKTNNEGFLASGYPSKVSPIITPPDGRIGGHCVVYAANCIPEAWRGPILEHLAHYNDQYKAPIKADKN